jgi:hypothetical protein
MKNTKHDMLSTSSLGEELEAVTLPTIGSCPEEEKMKHTSLNIDCSVGWERSWKR